MLCLRNISYDVDLLIDFPANYALCTHMISSPRFKIKGSKSTIIGRTSTHTSNSSTKTSTKSHSKSLPRSVRFGFLWYESQLFSLNSRDLIALQVQTSETLKFK